MKLTYDMLTFDVLTCDVQASRHTRQSLATSPFPLVDHIFGQQQK